MSVRSVERRPTRSHGSYHWPSRVFPAGADRIATGAPQPVGTAAIVPAAAKSHWQARANSGSRVLRKGNGADGRGRKPVQWLESSQPGGRLGAGGADLARGRLGRPF